MLALQGAGYDVYLPFGENTRYDLAIDDGSCLRRVQCKTGRLREGGIRFAVCSCYGHHRNPKDARRDYQGQVDLFGVYCPETLGVYLVPIEDLPVRVMVDPPRLPVTEQPAAPCPSRLSVRDWPRWGRASGYCRT